MLLPFDMLAAMLFLSYYAESPDPNPPPPSTSLLMTAAAAFFMIVAACVVNVVALRALRRPGVTVRARRDAAGRADLLLRALLATTYAICLVESRLPWSLARHWGLDVRPESFAVQLFGLAPYVLLFFAAWLPMYRTHRETTPGLWTRGGFLLHKARYNLYMLLAWIPFALLADFLGDFLALLPALFLVAAWAFPWVLARAWGCTPVADEAILGVVRRLEERAGVRFSRVYLWEPGGGAVQNAAAVGILPPFRYLFLTPALVRSMREEELEAVILHELGHVRKKHLLFYLFTSLAGINAAVLTGLFLQLPSIEGFVVTVALVLAYFRVVFGWLSRNMERQADLFALERSGSARGLANALEKLGISAGNIRLASSWHHLGIAERVDFLRRAERHPELARRHNHGVRLLMAGGYLVSAVLLGGMVWLAADDMFGGRTGGAMVVREDDARAHWRRVMRIMPDDAGAALELAHRLAGGSATREEAARLADRAVRLADSGEVRDAALKLLGELHE